MYPPIMLPWRIKDTLSFTFVVLFSLSAAWVKLGHVPTWIIVVMSLWLVFLSTGWAVPSLQERIPLAAPWKREPIALHHVCWGILFSIPTFIYLTMKWKTEIPFFGDQLYHLITLLHVKAFWTQEWLPTGMFLLFLFLGLHSRRPINLCWLAVPFFLMAVLRIDPTTDFTFAERYPAVIYMFQLPFLWIAKTLHIADLLNVLELFSALSIPVWLFLLRPLLLHRWPDERLFPIAALLLFQKEFVYYFTANYLEPWPLIICFLALESLLTRPTRDAWIACWLIGIAAMMKEQCIFLLPFIFLAGFSWRKCTENTQLLIASLNSIICFLAYYAVRQAFMPDIRPYSIDDLSVVFSQQHFAAFAESILTQWKIGIVALALSVFLLTRFCILRDQARKPARAMLLGAVCVTLFFFADTFEIDYPAYSRYFLLVWLLCGTGFLLAGIQWKRSVVLSLGIMSLLFNTPPLTLAFQQAMSLAPARNYLEHHFFSVFFPLRSIVQQAERKGILLPDDPLTIILHSVSFYQPKYDFEFGVNYTDLVSHHTITIAEDLENDLPTLHQCICTATGAVAFFPMYYTNLRSDAPERGHQEETAARCLSSLRHSCVHIIDLYIDEKVVGLLGTGQRTP